MAYKWRDEVVGKRFLCVTTVSSSKIKVKKINEWNWRQGIIRASNRSHTKHNDLTVLVEYDGVDWRKREWIKVYDQQFHVFLIEYNIVWSTRADTVLGKNKQWLALNFKILVDKVGLRDSQLKPIEYLDDRQLDFVDYNALKLYEDFDLTKDPYRSVSCLQKYIRQWSEYQDSQKILLTTPSVLVGYRVKVYRSEGTTQWYTAVIVSYNENTKELTLTDDTVLEERNEDPTLVQMKLIGDGVVESILKGEEIGITPRRRACNQNSRETTTATSLNNSLTTNNNNVNTNARKLTNPSNNNSANHHPNRVKNSNSVNNLSNVNVSTTTTVTTNTSTTTTTTTSTINSRVNSHNDNNNNSLTTNNCNTNDDNIRNNKHINTGNEKEIAVKTNNKSSKHSDSNCIGSVMNSSVTKADVNNSNFDSSLKSNYHRFGLDLSDQQAHSLQSKAQKNQNQEYQQQQKQANNQDQVNQQQRNTSVRLNNSHNHSGSNFSSVTTTSTTSKTNSQSKSSSSPTSSINSTTYSNSLMHLHMTPSQSGSHLPRPPCPPNGDRTTGPPSTSIASSIHHQQQHHQQQHHLHHQQQQQHIQQSHHHLSSTPSSSIPKSSASSLESQNSSTMSRPPPGIISPYSNAIGNYQAMLMLQHQQELLWQKYPEMRGMTASSGNPDNRLLTPYQINDWKMIQERERDNRQLQEKMKLEDKMRERLEREAKDRESKERDKFLKERAEKEKKQREAVDQHFVESLRLANQKQRAVTTGWPQMAKGNSGNPNHPPPPQSPVRSQQQSQPPVSSSGNNSLPRSYIPMFNGDAEKESGESKSANSSNCSSRSSSSATSSHQPNNNNVNNNNNNSNNNNSNNNNNNNNNNSNSNNMVHSDARLIRNLEQRHHQQTSQTPKSQQQSRSGNKVDYRSTESNLSHLHAAAAAQQFSVLSQQQSHSPNGPQHPLHLIHAPSWGVPRSGVSSDGGSPSQGKGSQSHQPGHPGALPLHLQSHHGPIGPGQLNPSQLQFVNNMSVNGSRLLAHYDAKISSLMRENSSSPSLSTTSKKTNASPVNTNNNNNNNSNSNSNNNNPRDNNNGSNSVNSVGSRADPSKLGPNHRANSENLGPYGYTPYGYPPPPPRSSGIKDTPPPHPPPPPSLPPPHLAVGKLNSSTNISNPLNSAPNSRNCFSPMGNSLGRPPSGPSPSRPPPPAHSGGSSSSIISGPEKREPSPLIDRSGTPLGRNTGTPLGRPSSASSSKHLSGKVAHQFNSVDRISPLYHNSGSQSSSSSTSSLQSGQQGQPSGPPHSSSLFSQQTQLSGVPLMSAPPAHQSSSPGLATSRSNTPQLSSSNVQSHQPVVLPSSTNSSSSSAGNHLSLTNLTSSSTSLPSSQDQPQNLVKSEVKVRNNLNSVNSNSQSLSNNNVSSKGQHLQGTHTPSYMKHSQFKAEEHKSNLMNSSDRYSINGPNMDTSKQQQHFTPINNAGVIPGGPGGGMYPHYMKGLSPSRYNLSSGQSVSPHVMGYEVSRSRTAGPNMPYNLTHPSNSFDGQLKGPNDHLAGGNNKAMNMNSFKVNSDVRMSAETINLDTHHAHSHHSGKGSSSIPSFSGNNTITISPASAATTLTITTSPLTSISPTGTIVKSGANSSNNGTRLVPGNLPSGYLPSNIHPMMGQSNHHLSTHSHHGQSSSHPISLTNSKAPLGPMTGPPVSNGSSGSIIHGLPVTSDKKGLSVSPSMTISTKDSIEYEQGKRKGMHKEIYDATKKIKKEEEDNVNNRSGNSKSMGRLAASPTEFVHQTSPLSNAQPIILIKEEKNVYALNENKKSPLTNHFEHDFGDHKIQPTFNSSKSTIETPMTITSTMLPPPSLNTSTIFSNSSPITPATSTPSTQSGSTTSITISAPVTTVRESPTTVTSNETSTPSKFHPKLKKAWLQRHSEAEVESNSNQSTSSALSVNNTLNNLTSNSVKEEERCKQPSPSIHKSQQSHHHKIKPSSQIKSDQHSDASASSSPRVKRKISREEKNKKRSKKDPSSDEDGDETSSVSDFDFNGDKSNSSAPEKSKSSKSGLIKKRITSRNASKRHKGSGGSNSGSGSENKKDDYKWSKDERERRRKTKESKINARRGRKPKSSTRGSKESKDPKEQKEPKEPKEPKESKESNGTKDSFREKESKKKSSKEGSLVLKPTSLEVLKKTGQPFLQDGSCYDVAPRLPKCRECRMTPNQRNKKMPNIFCRFYAFRKLKYGKNGVVTDSGFSEPQDASNYDLELWLPPEESCSDLDMETSKFLINHVGDQFCDLVKQEQQALKMHMGKDKTITWKRVVQGVREMCDVCETTLFNIHWVCHKCGFVICIDCYKARKTGAVKEEVNPPRDRDEYQWLLCTNRQPHEQDKLMMTQIIASTALNDVGKMLHLIRKIYSIPAHCGCDSSSIVCANGLSIKMPDVKALRDKMESSNGKKGNILNGGVKGDSKSDAVISKDSENSTLTGFSSESGSSPLSWLADVALSSSKIGSEEAGKDSQPALNDGSSAGKSDEEEKSKEETDEHNFSTLRELLIRPTSKKGKGSKKRKKKGSQDDDNNENDVNDAEDGEDNEEEEDENDETTSDEGEPEDIRVKKKTKKDECDDKTSSNFSSTSATTTGSTTTSSSAVSNTTVATNTTESIKLTINSSALPKDEAKRLEHYRRLFIPKRGIVSSPSRSCSVEETKKLFPNIPHTWLCSGRLLVLQDPKLSDNLKLFQEQWKRGQPVLVNGVSKLLDPTLWSPEEFNKSFGDSKNDLVNCKTGHVLPKLPMKKFWDGFENLNKRMKGEDGDLMTLKLKDWPPGDDFSDLLPDHYADLMECLPLPEYTRRDGCLNLAGRLPECFVRPDLGPKMYNAYGSALPQDKGTTNLHLDISDAVNIMVYVGIPKGGSKSEDFHEIALKALDEGGCDEEMKKRCREKGNKLGALWHIYEAKHADAIRDLLNKISKERGVELGAHHDPIHDQSWYLDSTLRARLKSEYGVEGYAIAQCLGDAVFIPAGAPHQVRNLQSCIKVAGDFVSPENVTQCFNLTQEFRQLSDSHINHEDKLQIKNIIYHAIKDSLASLAVSDSNKSTSHNNNKSCSVSSKSTNNTTVNPSTTPTSTKAH